MKMDSTTPPNESKSANDTKASSKSKKPEQRVTIKKWDAVAFWSWVDPAKNEECVCTSNVMDKCFKCKERNDPSEECPIAWGVCKHAYHLHCLAHKALYDCRCGERWKLKEVKKYAR